jgi:sialidase-1
MKIPISIILCTVLLSCSISCKQDASTDPEITPVILWGKNNTSHNNYRIPSLIVTKKGTLLAFAEGRDAGDAGNIDILLKRSEDNGKTWSEQIVVWDDADNTCGNPCPVVDQTSGRIILFMTWNLGADHESKILKKESLDTRRPYLCYSDDDGLSWSIPEEKTHTCKDPSWGWYATGPGVGIQLKSEKYKNRLIIPSNNSYNEENEDHYTRYDGVGYSSHVLLSDDNGQSWRMSENIKSGCNESQIVELSDGSLMMNMRSYNDKDCRAVAISNDGGETWSDIEHTLQLVEPKCQASIVHYGDYAGKEMYLFSNPATTSSRTMMTVKTSFDDCKTWSNSKLIYSGEAAYSCLTVLPNGDVGLFFEIKGSDARMVFVVFPPGKLFKPGALLDINQNIRIYCP